MEDYSALERRVDILEKDMVSVKAEAEHNREEDEKFRNLVMKKFDKYAGSIERMSKGMKRLFTITIVLLAVLIAMVPALGDTVVSAIKSINVVL